MGIAEGSADEFAVVGRRWKGFMPFYVNFADVRHRHGMDPAAAGLLRQSQR